MRTTLIAAITIVAVLVPVVWFDRRCLADTSDSELRLFTRELWALIIVVSFPIGPMLYLTYGKGTRRLR